MLTRAAPRPAATWAYGSDPDQVIDGYLPAAGPGSLPTVVLVHGGYWRPEYDRAHARCAAGGLAAAGFPTALAEYRRIPGAPDTLLEDVLAAVAAVARGATELPGGAVLVVGHSAGGHLALMAAQSPDVAGCLALAPVADLHMADALHLDDDAVREFLGSPAADRPDLDPACSSAPPCPTLVLHGTEDELVPIAVSQSYAHRTGVPLHPLAGVGHFAVIDPESAAWPVVIEHLHRLGAGPGAPGGDQRSEA